VFYGNLVKTNKDNVGKFFHFKRITNSLITFLIKYYNLHHIHDPLIQSEAVQILPQKAVAVRRARRIQIYIDIFVFAR